MAAPCPQTVSFGIYPPLRPTDVPGLCARVCTLLEQADARAVVIDVAGVAADAAAVDALARLQLAAARRRCRVQLRNASADVRALISFMGLSDVIA